MAKDSHGREVQAGSRKFIAAAIRTVRALARKLGRPPELHEYLAETGQVEWDVRARFKSFEKLLAAARVVKAPDPAADPKNPDVQARLRIASLEQQNKLLTVQVGELEDRALGSEAVMSLLGHIKGAHFDRQAEWMRGARMPKKTTGTPVLFISDVHFDEVVRPEQVEFSNEYNREIAERRLKVAFKKTSELLTKHLVAAKYDGIVCALGGDIISGNIHEELRETNEASILQTVLRVSEVLGQGIGALADDFGKVFVPCVVGNHGRLDDKPRAKGAVHDNFDWLIYMLIAREFRSDPRVTFMIPDSLDAQFQIYSRRIRLTHGNQFRGGTGISGIYTPLMLGRSRKLARQQAIGNPFDLMMFGHFHDYIHAELLVGNGSVKGYDEYAYSMNFQYQRPKQALWVEHPDLGMTYRVPIVCDDGEKPPAR